MELLEPARRAGTVAINLNLKREELTSRYLRRLGNRLPSSQLLQIPMLAAVICLPHVLGFTSLMPLQQSPVPVSFQELFSKEAVASLAKQLKEAASITDIIEVAEHFFEPAFLSGSDANNWLKSILQYMETVPHDEITVSKLVKLAHVSVKTLERRFLKTIGISPKMFCKIIRFQNAVKEIQSKNGRSKTKIPSVSLASGYYDQSHFAKESKHFTGHSPKKMLLHFVAETSDVILLPLLVFSPTALGIRILCFGY